jgi:cation transport regulator
LILVRAERRRLRFKIGRSLALEPIPSDERFVARSEECGMPYRSDQELPDSVKNALPSHAQDIYREAFDNAWDEYSDPSKRRGNESLEEVAHKVAWAAVKKQYEKVGSEWRPKS